MAVIVVEPHALLRLGILQLLADVVPNLQLEGVDYSSLVDEVPVTTGVDLVLLSVPPYEKMIELAHAVQRVYAPTWILLLSDTAAMPYSLESLPSEVAGYIPKSASPDVLTASVRLVLAGGKCFPLQAHREQPLHVSHAGTEYPADHSSRHIPENRNKPNAEMATEAAMLGITPRQYEVLVLLARGYPIKTISRHLNISVATAKAHAETLYQRLDVHSRNEAVYSAISRGATLGWQHLDAAMSNPPPVDSVVSLTHAA